MLVLNISRNHGNYSISKNRNTFWVEKDKVFTITLINQSVTRSIKRCVLLDMQKHMLQSQNTSPRSLQLQLLRIHIS